MFWATLWPLVLGFSLSGAVQAFVSHNSMQKKLGNHGPAAVARASTYGLVSSSCSYAASAMSKSLFAKGADFVSANVFMFASTNLVVELGVVLVVLLGWQFAASEFVGGIIMIVLLSVLGGLCLRGRLVTAARQRLSPDSRKHTHGPPENTILQHQPWRMRIRSKGGWADAATYTLADLEMLAKELAIGYLAAGFLATLVPVEVWKSLFFHGHGFWTSLENVIVGPLIAIVSFVCSVGNVALAAALWKGGISFGGVVSFIFADLISLPVLLVYRRYYGTRLMLRMLGIFWLVMSATGLVTEVLFRAAGLIPSKRPDRIVSGRFEWNYTTYLNVAFLVLFASLLWAYRNRERLGGGHGYASDPVCGMQVETANAPVSVQHEESIYYLCSDRCFERFTAAPDSFLRHEPIDT